MLNISTRYEDICDRNLKLAEMAPNSASFGKSP